MPLIAVAVIVLVASFVRSIAGFGFALVASPFLLLVLEPKSVVVINNILGVGLGMLVLFHMRRHVDVRRAALICVGVILGIPLGAYVLSSVNPQIIKLLIAVLIIPFSLLLLLGHSHQFKRDAIGCGITGFVSGALTSSTSIGGPPVVLFLLNQGLVKERFVGTLAACFLFANCLTFGAFSFMDLVTADILRKIAILLPVLLLGFYLGTRVLPRIDRSLFRRIVTSILSILALVIIVTSILELT